MKAIILVLEITLICLCSQVYGDTGARSLSETIRYQVETVSCTLPPEVGPCDAAIPRYYYNVNSGTCEQFIYGGCGGNANNYSTFNLCITACGEVCQLEPEVGPCDAAIPRFYYDVNSGTCEQFIYGGCGGNANNYSTFNLCISACGEVCQLEPEVGPCDAAIPRYYYNTNSGTCEQFIYGGCGGNQNNYGSYNKCISACGEICQLEPEVGPCDQALTRWYFDTTSGQCETFIYGGCEGNANRYLSKALCMTACGDVCYLPPDPGPCQAVIPRYYFNPNTGLCQQFIYGGCGGNANNYSTYTQCMNTCAEPCDMPADSGPCQAAIPRYFYNRVTEQCERFVYGGCGGNANNYPTIIECESVCPCPSSIHDDYLYSSNMNIGKDVSGHITSRSIVSDSARLLYSAIDYVSLLPGFSVEKDSRLHVILEGCLDN